jgi:PAS domain S-box-containing protein
MSVSPRTILCVDDEVAGLRLRATILESNGFKVLTAGADEALFKFQNNQIDLVISDHLMGCHTGIQLARDMKRLKPEVPILIVSGTAEIPVDIHAADDFLSKLEGPEALLLKVQRMLKRPAATVPEPKADRTRDLERAYEELRESQARLAGILASTMDAIITVDEQQRIVLFNQAAEKLFGYRSEEIMGQLLDGLIPDSLRAAHRLHIRNFGKAGITTRSMHSPRTLSGLRSNGEEFPIEATISQVELSGQKLFTVVLRDITERSRAEDELRNSERLAVADVWQRQWPMKSITPLIALRTLYTCWRGHLHWMRLVAN